VAQAQKPMVQITRAGVVIWAALFFFIAGWMFVLGILVGRRAVSLPAEARPLERELTDLKTAMLEKERGKAEAQADGAADPKQELGFYQALKEARPDTRFKVSRPSEPSRSAAEKAAPAKASPPKQEVAPAAPTAQSVPAPKAEPAPAPKTETVKNADPEAQAEAPSRVAPKPEPAAEVEPPAGRFTVQVAAAKEVQSAERLVAQLRSKGYPAYQLRVETADKGVWHRVRVGAFKERQAAEAMLKKLNGDQIKGLIVSTP
jgi:cell division septation protein DedD